MTTEPRENRDTYGTIRRLSGHDFDAVLSLYSYLKPDDPPIADRERAQTLWSELVSQPHLIYPAFDLNRQVVSCCALTIVPNLTHGMRSYGLIENVVTHPQYRNQGYGTAVLKAAQQIAWQYNYYKVMLATGSQRETTLRFYRNAGFQQGTKTAFVAYSH